MTPLELKWAHDSDRELESLTSAHSVRFYQTSGTLGLEGA